MEMGMFSLEKKRLRIGGQGISLLTPEELSCGKYWCHPESRSRALWMYIWDHCKTTTPVS